MGGGRAAFRPARTVNWMNSTRTDLPAFRKKMCRKLASVVGGGRISLVLSLWGVVTLVLRRQRVGVAFRACELIKRRAFSVLVILADTKIHVSSFRRCSY